MASIQLCLQSNPSYVSPNFTLNESDFNVWPYVECFRGPQRQDLTILLPITVINVVIFITGILGNLAVCVVISLHKQLHSATNCYLFNLAVSDILLLTFGLPNDLALFWYPYPWILGVQFCKLRALISEAASYVSVLTILAFSTERYLAICFPLNANHNGLRRVFPTIAIIWLLACISAIPFAKFTVVNYIQYPFSDIDVSESALCVFDTKVLPICELSTVLFFMLPLVIIIYQYKRMCTTISNCGARNEEEFRFSVRVRQRRIRTNKNVVRMLRYVVIGFFVCWAPFHIQRLNFIYLENTSYFKELNFFMYITTGVCYYLSSTFNPIIYNIYSEKMRQAIKATFTPQYFKRKQAQKAALRATPSRTPSDRNTQLEEASLMEK